MNCKSIANVNIFKKTLKYDFVLWKINGVKSFETLGNNFRATTSIA